MECRKTVILTSDTQAKKQISPVWREGTVKFHTHSLNKETNKIKCGFLSWKHRDSTPTRGIYEWLGETWTYEISSRAQLQDTWWPVMWGCIVAECWRFEVSSYSVASVKSQHIPMWKLKQWICWATWQGRQDQQHQAHMDRERTYLIPVSETHALWLAGGVRRSCPCLLLLSEDKKSMAHCFRTRILSGGTEVKIRLQKGNFSLCFSIYVLWRSLKYSLRLSATWMNRDYGQSVDTYPCKKQGDSSEIRAAGPETYSQGDT